MTGVCNHYESLLAAHYTWMAGGRERNYRKNTDFFKAAGIDRHAGGTALDLGCGSGFQAIALARMGFTVTGIDLSPALLAELAAQKGDLPICLIHDDLMHVDRHCPEPADLAVCMGDTLSHLDARETVSRLFETVHACLKPGGHFIITYRDLSVALKGTDRFIPVCSDNTKIMTCFLEYKEERVTVHDLVYEKQGSGWVLNKSCYDKLRLSRDWVAGTLKATGFRLVSSGTENGMTSLVAARG